MSKNAGDHPTDGNNADNKADFLGTVPVGRLIARLAVPGSLALFVNSAYNFVDTIFVGRGVGALAIGAVSLLFPFRIIVMSFGNLVGIGAASVVSRALGAGDNEKARDAAGGALSMAALLGLIVGALGFIFTAPLVRLLGGTGELFAPTYEYTRIIVLSEPFLAFNFAGNFLIRAEGRARAAMITLSSGVLLNIILDPIFIFALDMGIGGAALATLLGHMVTTVLIAGYFITARGSLRIRLRSLWPRRGLVGETLWVGSSGFVRQFSQGVVQIVRNNLLVAVAGSMAVAAFGAVFRTIIVLALPAMGVAQALPPIAGYNFGAGNPRRVRRSLKLSIGVTTLITAAAAAILLLLPGPILRIFSSEAALIETGSLLMRLSAPVLLFFPTYFIGTAFYQAIGKGGRALLLALARPGFGLVGMLIAAAAGSAPGIVVADPIAVALGALAVWLLVRHSFRVDPKLRV